MYRLALAPSHVGNETLAKLMFGSTLSVTTVRRSKLRFAACLRKMHQHVLMNVVDGTGRAVEARCNEAEEEILKALTRPLAIADAPSDADSPSDAMEVQIMPLILSLAWKWDGTPLPAFLCNPVSLPAPHTESSLAVPGNVTNVTVKSPGPDCFVQRGMLARFAAQGQFRTMRIPVPAKPLWSGSARNMLAGMELLPVVEKLVRIASSPRLPVAHLQVLIVILSLCCDAASANFLVVKHLISFFKVLPHEFRNYIVLIAHNLCSAHQVHLGARSSLYSIDQIFDGEFIKGLCGASHIFGCASYALRITSALGCVVNELKFSYVRPQLGVTLSALGSAACKKALLLYLMKWVMQVQVVGQKIEAAIEVVVLALNFDWHVDSLRLAFGTSV